MNDLQFYYLLTIFQSYKPDLSGIITWTVRSAGKDYPTGLQGIGKRKGKYNRLGLMNGWMTWVFMAFSAVFQSFEMDGRMNEKEINIRG